MSRREAGHAGANAAAVAAYLGGKKTDFGGQLTCPLCKRDRGVTLSDKAGAVVVEPNCDCPDVNVRDVIKGKLNGLEIELLTREEQQEREDNPQTKPTSGELIRTGDQWRREYRPLAYSVDNLFVSGQLVAATGKTQSGKTAFAMKLAGCKANGTAFAGRDCPKGHVLYIAVENEVDTLQRYICMVESETDFDETHFHVRTATDRKPVGAILEEFERYIDAKKIKLSMVIVDTAPAMSPVEDELNNTQQGDYARALRRFCTLRGRPVTIALCHPNKHPHNASECLPRGGGALLNEFDANVTLWSSGELVEVAFTKLRQPPWHPFQFRFAPVEATKTNDAKGNPLRSVTVEFIDDAERERVSHQRTTDIEKVLRTMGTATDGFFRSKRAIGEASGLILPGADKDHASVRAVRRLVDDMMSTKAGAKPLIHCEVFGRYSLTSVGRALAKKLNGDAR